MKDSTSDWAIPDTSIALVGNSTCLNLTPDYVEVSCNAQCHFDPTIYTASGSSDADWLLVGLFCFPMNSAAYCCKQSFFLSLVIALLKKCVFFFFVFEQSIANENAVHQFSVKWCDTRTLEWFPYPNIFKCLSSLISYICGVFLRCLVWCGLGYF